MKVETKVGFLFLITLAMVGLFAYYLGAFNPFTNRSDLYVTYNFAGGLEVGSPVRVMGIKVGKVSAIEFDPNMKDDQGREVKLRIRIAVDRKAWPTIRRDSQFFINLAGVIGEKFLEITPGSVDAERVEPGSIMRGVDPPRIDQLISQSYSLAGRMIEFVEKNEGTVVETMDRIESLVNNLNRTLVLLDQVSKNKRISKLFDNSILITEDLAALTSKLRSKRAEESYEIVYEILSRLKGLDEKEIRKFLQEEGIRARIF